MGGRGWKGGRLGLTLSCFFFAVAHVHVQHRQGTQRGTPAIVKPRSPFGVVAFDLSGPVPQVLQTLGVGVVRGSCSWQDLEPARGVFNWACSDNVIVGAQALHLRSYMTVVCAPEWANNNAGCGEMPADITDWYFFVANFVTRYQHFDTILGIWNEPNLSLHDTASGQNYALLFINASNARNTVNPRFPLAGPETSHHAAANGYYRQTMDTIESYGALDSQDIVAVHWYPDGPPVLDYLDTIHGSASSRDVWLSETGDATVDPAQQADFYDRMLQVFEATGRPWWTHIVFYRLWNGHDCCSEAIVKSDYSPTPAFYAFRNWILKPHAVPRSAGD